MESHDEDLDFHIFDIETISAATNNFSLNNKIGQGGFGIVYKVNKNSILPKKLVINQVHMIKQSHKSNRLGREINELNNAC